MRVIPTPDPQGKTTRPPAEERTPPVTPTGEGVHRVHESRRDGVRVDGLGLHLVDSLR